MAIDSREAGAAFAAGAQPELTKTKRAGTFRSRDFEDRSRRLAQKDAVGAREAWRRETDNKIKKDARIQAVDSNIGFDAKRDAGGKRESTGDARLDNQIQRTEQLFDIAQNISEMGDFSKIEAEFDRLGLTDIVIKQYDKIPQLKPIADILKDTNTATRLPDAQRKELIRHLVADHDFAKHMMDRLKPLMKEGVVPDYNLPEMRKKLAELQKEMTDLNLKEEQYLAQKSVYVTGITDLSGDPNRNIEIKRAQDFIDKAKKGNDTVFNKVDKYIDLRNKRAYFEHMKLKATTPAEKNEWQSKYDALTTDFTNLDADPQIVASRGATPTGIADTIKNYIISRDTIDLTEGSEWTDPTGRKATETARLTTEIAAQNTKITDAQTKRTQDENEYVIKVRDAIGESAYDTLIGRMDANMAYIQKEIKESAGGEMGKQLNRILTREGLFGETADRGKIQSYFNTLIESGEEAAIDRMNLDPEFQEEVLNNPDLKAKFNETILYNAMKYGGLRRENLDRIMNLPWGEKAINDALRRNSELVKFEEQMKQAGFMKGGMVEWLRSGKNKNLIAAVITALLTGVGAATVVGLASIPAAGLAGVAAVGGGMIGGMGANRLGEAA